jgi:hypothetical protein
MTENREDNSPFGAENSEQNSGNKNGGANNLEAHRWKPGQSPSTIACFPLFFKL